MLVRRIAACGVCRGIGRSPGSLRAWTGWRRPRSSDPARAGHRQTAATTVDTCAVGLDSRRPGTGPGHRPSAGHGRSATRPPASARHHHHPPRHRAAVSLRVGARPVPIRPSSPPDGVGIVSPDPAAVFAVPRPGQLDVHDVAADRLEATVDGSTITVTATWTNGVEPCSILDTVIVDQARGTSPSPSAKAVVPRRSPASPSPSKTTTRYDKNRATSAS